MVSLYPQLHGLPEGPSSKGPLDDLWMTPAMGQRMRFDFALSVIDMTEKTEQKKRAAEVALKQKAVEKQKPAPTEKPAPPIPPPVRLLRY
jgi:hypothetical protein